MSRTPIAGEQVGPHRGQRPTKPTTPVIVPKPGEYLLPIHVEYMNISRLAFARDPRRGRPRGKSAGAITKDRHMAHEVVRLEHDGVEPGEAKAMVARAFKREFKASRRQVERALENHRAEAEAERLNYVENLVRLGKLPAPNK